MAPLVKRSEDPNVDLAFEKVDVNPSGAKVCHGLPTAIGRRVRCVVVEAFAGVARGGRMNGTLGSRRVPPPQVPAAAPCGWKVERSEIIKRRRAHRAVAWFLLRVFLRK